MVKPSQVVAVDFTTRNPSTGAAKDAKTTPTGVLVVDGVDNAAVVTVGAIATGIYSASVTIPALTAGQVVQIRIAATVVNDDSVDIADNAIIWQDVVDSKRTSDLQDIAAGALMGLADDAITAAKIADDAIDAGSIKADAVTKIQSGLALAGGQMDLVNAPNSTAITAIQSGLATATNVANSEAAIRGTDDDTLKTLSAQLDTAQVDLDSPDQYKANVSGLALEATLTAMKGGSWSSETLKAIYDLIVAVRGTDDDTLKTLSAQLDTAQADLDNPGQYKADVSALAIELNVQGHVADALDTVVPALPTAGSINERVKAMDDKLPSSAYLKGSADADGGMDAADKVDVNAEVDAALVDIDLDHLAKASYGITKPAVGSLFDKAMNKGVLQTFDPATDSLEALGDGGGVVPAVGAIADGVWDELEAGHIILGSYGLRVQRLGPGSLGTLATVLIQDVGLNPVADADVWVSTDLAGNHITSSGQSNSSGLFTFFGDVGVTYYVWAQKNGYNVTNPSAITVV